MAGQGKVEDGLLDVQSKFPQQAIQMYIVVTHTIWTRMADWLIG